MPHHVICEYSTRFKQTDQLASMEVVVLNISSLMLEHCYTESICLKLSVIKFFLVINQGCPEIKRKTYANTFGNNFLNQFGLGIGSEVSWEGPKGRR